MSKSNEQPLGEIIDELLRHYNLRDRWASARVVHSWERVVGSYIASHTTDIHMQHGVLFVFLDSDALRNELLYAKTLLMNKLNEIAGDTIVEDIVFK